MQTLIQKLDRTIRNVPDFPKPGILFKDITPLLADAAAFRETVRLLAERVEARKPTKVVGVESRGFIFAAPLADRLGIGFAPVRKPGKLPYRRVTETYELEYGSGTLEMHEDAVAKQRVVIIDDVLATGGTAAGAARLCEKQGAHVLGFGFVLELSFLNGRRKLGEKPMVTLLSY